MQTIPSPELPPLLTYEDDITTMECKVAFEKMQFTPGSDWTDCDRGSFGCANCPLTRDTKK